MRVSGGFVVSFLVCFLIVILGNIIALSFNEYKIWMACVLGLMVFVFSFLLGRKKGRSFKKSISFILPILFILAALYFIFLPFGFQKDYNIIIGEEGSVFGTSSEAWLEDLSGNKIENLRDVYDYGQINLMIKSRAFLRNTTVNVTVYNSELSNVYLAKIDQTFNKSQLDYVWNFVSQMPSGLTGSANYSYNKSCVYFNSSKNQTLKQPGSTNMFEKESFIASVEWKPESNLSSGQQLLGHYNWELLQNNDSVSFQIGFVNNTSGEILSVKYPISNSFFNSPHSALAVYFAEGKSGAGYIELYVDGNFAGRETINNKTILTDYNSQYDLSFGKSLKGPYYSGCIYSAAFDYTKVNHLSRELFTSYSNEIKVPLVGKGKFNEISLTIKK